MTMSAVNIVQYFVNFLKNTVSLKNGESVILVSQLFIPVMDG